jgi:hypothetical protein
MKYKEEMPIGFWNDPKTYEVYNMKKEKKVEEKCERCKSKKCKCK